MENGSRVLTRWDFGNEIFLESNVPPTIIQLTTAKWAANKWQWKRCSKTLYQPISIFKDWITQTINRQTVKYHCYRWHQQTHKILVIFSTNAIIQPLHDLTQEILFVSYLYNENSKEKTIFKERIDSHGSGDQNHQYTCHRFGNV